jgi:ribosomal protein S18 acetylase RimI-like enzyme
MKTEVKIRIASEADLEALMHLATAFRDYLGQSLPSEADFRQSLALLLKDAGTEFFLACDALGMALGYVQARYRYSAWTLALEAELEDVFVVPEARRHGVGRRLMEFALARAIARGAARWGSTRTSIIRARWRCIGSAALSPNAPGGTAAGSCGC